MLGLPYGMIFELHGWWHILTGIGAYVGMALVEYLVTMGEEGTVGVEQGFAWPIGQALNAMDRMEKKEKGM